MAKLINYEVTFTGTEASINVLGSYSISGYIDPYVHSSTWNTRYQLADDLNVADFRYYIRVSIVADTVGRGTADIKYTITDYADSFDTTGSAIHASNAGAELNAGSFGLTGWVEHYTQSGSFTLLAQVVQATNGSFNIVLVDDSYDQMSGSFNIGSELLVGQDIAGNYNLYAVVDGVLIKIDIIPDEIKQALITSGVKFS